MSEEKDQEDASRFNHDRIDDLIHGRLWLGVMAYLATNSPAIFGELKEKVKATDGNLSTHLRKLEDGGYVTIEKRFEGRRPQTRVHLTEDGRTAWIAYLDQLRDLLSAAE